MPIHYFHVFSYSERKFARSTKKDNKVSADIIAKRSKILRGISDKKRRDYYNQFKGKQVNVLFESQKKQVWTGLTDNYIKVYHESADNLKNVFKTVVF